MVNVTKESLAAMIAALESQPHLSLKEEKYLAVCRELECERSMIADIKELPYAAEEDCPYMSNDANYAAHYADGYNEALSDIRFYL